MAEGILKKILQEQGSQLVSVSSAGTGAVEGLPANFLALSVATQYGVNLISHRSRPITKKLLERNDLIIVMAQDHYDFIAEKFPKYADKVVILKNYGREEPVEEPDIPDPIGAEGEVFHGVFQQLEEEAQRITPIIISESMNKS